MSHPAEALRAMMEGRLDRLQELLNRVRSMENDTMTRLKPWLCWMRLKC